MITFFKDSLREKSKKELEKQGFGLKRTDYLKVWAKTNLSQNSVYKYVLGFIIITLIFCCFVSKVSIPFLNFLEFSIDTAPNILEQRISNVATIIGVSLTVSTIMISNIADKKKENYDAIFHETYIYPIVYYALGILILFMMISAFRSYFISEGMFINLVIAAHYLIGLLVFLIGYLFYNIIKFFNIGTINRIHIQSLLTSAKYFLNKDIIFIKNYETLESSLKTSGISIKNDSFFDTKYSLIYPNSIGNIDDKKVLYDIKIDRLCKKLKKISSENPEKLFYRLPVFLKEGFELIFYNGNLDKKTIDLIQVSFVYKKIDIISYERYSSSEALILSKLSDAVKANSKNDIEFFLDNLIELYLFFIDSVEKIDGRYFRNSRILKVLKDLNSNVFIAFNPKREEDDDDDERERVKKAKKKRKTDLIYIEKYLFRLLKKLLKKESTLVFDILIEYPNSLYYQTELQNEIQVNLFDLINVYPDFEQTTVVKNLKYYHYKVYSQISKNFSLLFSPFLPTIFVYLTSDNNRLLNRFSSLGTSEFYNERNFINANEQQTVIEAKNYSRTYYNHLFFAIKSWVFYCYNKKKVSLEIVLNILDSLNNRIYSEQTESLVNHYSGLLNNIIQNRDYLNLDDWDSSIIISFNEVC